MPEDMRLQMQRAANKQFSSMNTFIVQALAEKLDRDNRQALLLDALAFAVTSQHINTRKTA